MPTIFSAQSAPVATTTTTGFSFGTSSTAGAGALGGGLFSNLSALNSASNNPVSTSSTAPTFGAFGSATPSAPPTGIAARLGSATTTASVPGVAAQFGAMPPATLNSAAPTLSLGNTAVAPTSTAPFSLFGKPMAATTASLGLTSTATSSGGNLAAPAVKQPTTGFSLFNTSATAMNAQAGKPATSSLTNQLSTPASSTGGLTLGGSTTTGGLTLGGSTTTGGLTLGGLGGSTTTTTSAPSKGLGGVDPAASGPNSTSKSSASDGKNIKEQNMPNELVQTVQNFKDHIKNQKTVREKITMISCQSMYKVQDHVTTMKQLLSAVATGLQRNVTAIEKLKQETAQELRNVEMAHRTRDTPAGLQYENTAPTEYFRKLLENFDSRMNVYRKLIEDAEGYLLGSAAGSTVSPKDLFICLKRLHEAFVALAAQLQGIHEAVKEQKEQYLNYRKVFHHDETDVFENRRKLANKAKLKPTAQPLGPNPFTGLSNYGAMLMTAAMSRQPTQQPVGGQSIFGAPAASAAQGQTNVFGGGNTTGFFGGNKTNFNFGQTAAQPLGSTFGFSNPAASSTTSSNLFGKPTPTLAFGSSAAAKPNAFVGFGTTAATTSSSIFGAAAAPTATTAGFGFQPTTGMNTFGFGTPAGAARPLGVATPNLAASAPAFKLEQPPQKRR